MTKDLKEVMIEETEVSEKESLDSEKENFPVENNNNLTEENSKKKSVVEDEIEEDCSSFLKKNPDILVLLARKLKEIDEKMKDLYFESKFFFGSPFFSSIEDESKWDHEFKELNELENELKKKKGINEFVVFDWLLGKIRDNLEKKESFLKKKANEEKERKANEKTNEEGEKLRKEVSSLKEKLKNLEDNIDLEEEGGNVQCSECLEEQKKLTWLCSFFRSLGDILSPVLSPNSDFFSFYENDITDLNNCSEDFKTNYLNKLAENLKALESKKKKYKTLYCQELEKEKGYKKEIESLNEEKEFELKEKELELGDKEELILLLGNEVTSYDASLVVISEENKRLKKELEEKETLIEACRKEIDETKASLDLKEAECSDLEYANIALKEKNDKNEQDFKKSFHNIESILDAQSKRCKEKNEGRVRSLSSSLEGAKKKYKELKLELEKLEKRQQGYSVSVEQEETMLEDELIDNDDYFNPGFNISSLLNDDGVNKLGKSLFAELETEKVESFEEFVCSTCCGKTNCCFRRKEHKLSFRCKEMEDGCKELGEKIESLRALDEDALGLDKKSKVSFFDKFGVKWKSNHFLFIVGGLSFFLLFLVCFLVSLLKKRRKNQSWKRVWKKNTLLSSKKLRNGRFKRS